MSGWYFNRLKTMSLAEILFRIRQSCQKQYELLSYKTVIPASDLKGTAENIIFTDPGEVRLFSSQINIFGRVIDFSSGELDWHRDIFSGDSFPVIFSKKINIRSNPHASAKNVWEINRLQFLTGIALNYRSTGKEEYLDLFVRILSSWIDSNPYLLGVNWYSNIEVNIRLINWFLCWQILGVDQLVKENTAFGEFVKEKWTPSIYRHCYYSYHNPSHYSSANNHLISEYAGLFIASSYWKFKESGKWLKYSSKGLEREIQTQHSSGVNREEAAEYIQFITDFFLLSFVTGEKTGRPFSESYRQQLHSIFTYICSFLDFKCNFPKYGDEDDGRVILTDQDEKFNNFKSLLTSGAIIFNDPELRRKSNGFDLKNYLLFGEEGRIKFESITDVKKSEGSEFYANEGHFIFRKRENDRESYLHFDAAPLGFLSIAAHGHADALSFILNVDGHPVFIDSGTYTYHTEPDWRKYFISTLAHNTIRINNRDQAVNGGPTLWLKHYKTSILTYQTGDDTDLVKATHDGYLSDNVRHTREVIFHRIREEFEITDTVELMKSVKTQVDIPFHLHPELTVSNLTKNTFVLSGNEIRKTEFIVDEKLEPKLVKGQLDPEILGWYSESFMKKEATIVIFCKVQIEKTTTFKFIIKII
jgi:hypothetical protein